MKSLFGVENQRNMPLRKSVFTVSSLPTILPPSEFAAGWAAVVSATGIASTWPLFDGV